MHRRQALAGAGGALLSSTAGCVGLAASEGTLDTEHVESSERRVNAIRYSTGDQEVAEVGVVQRPSTEETYRFDVRGSIEHGFEWEHLRLAFDYDVGESTPPELYLVASDISDMTIHDPGDQGGSLTLELRGPQAAPLQFEFVMFPDGTAGGEIPMEVSIATTVVESGWFPTEYAGEDGFTETLRRVE